MAQTSIINSANDYYLRDLLNPDSLLKYVIPKYQREYSLAQATMGCSL